MKKTLVFLVAMCATFSVRAQPFQRKVGQPNTEEFTIGYTFASDSLKGFFMITEQFSGKTKLLKAQCAWPYQFSNGRLQFSGEKIAAGTTAVFTFKMQEKNVHITGVFAAENFGSEILEMPLEEIRLEKPEPLLAAEEQNQGMANREQKAGNMYPEMQAADSKSPSNKVSEPNSLKPVIQALNQSEADNNQPGTDYRVPDTIYPISFRVQLAASTVPMDQQKIGKLSGLALPVYEDRIDQYYKYTIGNETSLQSAQSLLGRVAGSNFKKPFIVAYRQKERITVQQALAEINKSH